jgi:hypothetical protein
MRVTRVDWAAAAPTSPQVTQGGSRQRVAWYKHRHQNSCRPSRGGAGRLGAGGFGDCTVGLLVAGDGCDCGGPSGLAGEDNGGRGSMLLPWLCIAEATTMT